MIISKRQREQLEIEPDTECREHREIYDGHMEDRLIQGFQHFIAGMKENMQYAYQKGGEGYM